MTKKERLAAFGVLLVLIGAFSILVGAFILHPVVGIAVFAIYCIVAGFALAIENA